MSCGFCDIKTGNKSASKVYDDGKTIGFMAEEPATIGHVVVCPRQHLPIFEAMSDATSDRLFKTTNNISIAVFEAIKTQGTNIIIHNGVEAGQEEPHCCVNIIPRNPGDGLSFDWAPKQLSQEEMSTIELQLKEELSRPEIVPEATPSAEDISDEDMGDVESPKENYLIKQLKRMP